MPPLIAAGLIAVAAGSVSASIQGRLSTHPASVALATSHSLVATARRIRLTAARTVRPTPAHQTTYNVLTVIETGAIDHRNGPEFLPGSFHFPAHATVHMTVISFDDGPAPAPGYTSIKGVVGNAVTLNGKMVKSIEVDDIAHTFTVPGLGLNVPIPAAPAGKYVTVSFTFHTGGKGSYTWQCYAQCGAGKSGWGYPMTTNGMMRGSVTIG